MAYQSYINERYSDFIDLVQMVYDQRSAYEQTRNEKVLRVLKKLEARLQDARETEAIFCKQDFDEILNHPERYIEAVVTWAYYENREIS